MLKRVKMGIPLVLGFLDEDKLGTIHPHNDALVVMLRIGGYDVKRVMIDQGIGAEIMYPDLYKGLNLKPKNLTAYSSPLVSFEGKMVVPKGQIRLPVQTSPDVVEGTSLSWMFSLPTRPLWADPDLIPWGPSPLLFTIR